MPDPTDTPIIFTSLGNVPIADLQHFIEWTDTPDEVKFREVYKTADGVVVKESAHVLKRKGEALGVAQQGF